MIRKKYNLIGVDGNAFSIMGYVVNALVKSGLKDYEKEYTDKAMSGDYNNLLRTSMIYI